MTTHAPSDGSGPGAGSPVEPLTASEDAYVELGRAALRASGFTVTSELVLRSPVPGHSAPRVRIEYARVESGYRGVTSLLPSSVADPRPTVLSSLSRAGSSAVGRPRELGRSAEALEELGRDPSSWVRNAEYERLAAVVGRLHPDVGERLVAPSLGPSRILLVRAVLFTELDVDPFRSALSALTAVADGAPLAWVIRRLDAAGSAP